MQDLEKKDLTYDHNGKVIVVNKVNVQRLPEDTSKPEYLVGGGEPEAKKKKKKVTGE